MDRKEALEFLELPEFATPAEIKAKLETKLAYYEMLSEKAPSAFVRRLHTRNVARVKDIMQASATWPPAAAPQMTEMVTLPEMIEDAGQPLVFEPMVVEPEPAAVREPEPAVREPEPPVIKSRPSVLAEPEPVVAAAKPVASTAAAKQPATTAAARPATPEPVGWLIRHTENQSPVSYPLYPGKNYIGRKEKPGFSPFVRVEEDPYISKVHAVIIAEGKNAFFLADDLASIGDKPSTNGTYLNGNEDRVTMKTPLRSNDTIQIGITKLMFRYNDNALEDILDEVAGKDYMHTVVIHGL